MRPPMIAPPPPQAAPMSAAFAKLPPVGIMNITMSPQIPPVVPSRLPHVLVGFGACFSSATLRLLHT